MDEWFDGSDVFVEVDLFLPGFLIQLLTC
jgi:hypothetical protein